MFRDAKEETGNTNSIDRRIQIYIHDVKQCIQHYTNLLDEFPTRIKEKSVFFAPEIIAEYEMLTKAQTAQYSRLSTLKKMSDNQPITEEALRHLLLLSDLANDEQIANYPNIARPLKSHAESSDGLSKQVSSSLPLLSIFEKKSNASKTSHEKHENQNQSPTINL